MSNKIKVIPFIIENNLDRWDVIDHGFANGYVAIPPSHKYYGKRYDGIDIDVSTGYSLSDGEENRKTNQSRNIIKGDHRKKGIDDGSSRLILPDN